jgi:hypothetical protein
MKQPTNKPPVKIFFDGRSFNHLLFTLDRYISFEHLTGMNGIIQNAKFLKAKILKYAVPFTGKDGTQKCVVYFFANEVSALVELLNFSSLNGKRVERDYYCNLKHKKKNTT